MASSRTPKTSTQAGWTYGADQGLKYAAGAALPGVTVIPLLVTSTADPHSILFETHGLPNMADASYIVQVQAESAGAESGAVVDESTKAVTGFDVLNVAAGEIMNILVVGRIDGQLGVDGP